MAPLGVCLPEGVAPKLIAGRVDDFPVMQLAATGAGRERELVPNLRQYVVPALEGVAGIRDVSLPGVRERW